MIDKVPALRKLTLATRLVFLSFLVFSASIFFVLYRASADLDYLFKNHLIAAIKSAQVALDIGRSMADANVLINTCRNAEDIPHEEISRVMATMADLGAETQSPGLHDAISGFVYQLNDTLSSCKALNDLKQEKNRNDLLIHQEIESLDRMVSDMIISLKKEGQDTSILERLPLSIIAFRHMAMQLNLLFSTLGPEFFKKPLKQEEHPVLNLLNDFRLKIKILQGYHGDILSSGENTNALLDKLESQTRSFHQISGELAQREEEMKTARETLLRYLTESEKELRINSTERARSLKEAFEWIPWAAAMLTSLPLLLVIFSGLIARSAYASLKQTAISEMKYRTLIENLPQRVYMKDTNFIYVSCNPNFASDLGLAPDEIPGKTDDDLFPPDRVAINREYDTDILVTGKMLEKEETLNQNGKELTFHTIRVPLFEDGGALTGFMGISWDITERKRYEIALKESRERFELAILGSNDGIWDWNRKTDEVFFSRRWKEILGYEDHEIGNDILEWKNRIHPDDRDRVMKANNIFLETDADHFEVEYRLRHKDGNYRWILGRGACLRDAEGYPYRMSGSHTDITDRKRMEMELRQSYKMEAVGTLAGGIAHEFNNMLSIILGNADLAEEQFKTHGQIPAFLNEIRSASLRGRDIVRQLMNFSRPSDQKREVLDLGLITRDALRFLRASIPRTMEFRESIADKSDAIMGDPTQIHQVIINLCTNAAHAVGNKSGQLEIELKNVLTTKTEFFFDQKLPSGNYVCLRITDNGQGIEKENLDRIFDPFFTTKEVGKGSGMGLAVVHGIVKGHGGGIRIISKVGIGTTVECYFPSATEEFRYETRTREMDPIKGRGRVLFIDDEEAIAKIGQMWLERLGYDAEASTDPFHALDLVQASPSRFDVVITDLTMPRMSGDKLIRRVKEINPELKTAMSTGYNEKIGESEAKQMGADAFLMKPYTRQELAQVMNILFSDVS